MLPPAERLRRLQEQMTRVWTRFEVASDNGEAKQAGVHMEKFRDLEAHERELLAEVRARKAPTPC